jgi:hypothetical protein
MNKCLFIFSFGYMNKTKTVRLSGDIGLSSHIMNSIFFQINIDINYNFLFYINMTIN